MPVEARSDAFVIDAERQRVLEAVALVAADVGYPALTAEAIADRAGVSLEDFRARFTDADACFMAAYDDGISRLVTAVWTAFEAEHGWLPQVHAGLAAFLGFLAGDPVTARLLIVDARAAPAALERRHAALQGFVVFIRPATDEAPPGLHVPDIVTEHVVGGIKEIVFSRILEGATEQLPELLPDLVYCATVPYLGPRRAALAARKARRELSA
jgi:AcrR family transcriptional regulator